MTRTRLSPEYAGRVRLARQQERRGKTAGLNHTVPGLAGDIVVFSDANAMYAPDALMKLAANFADAEVGCVTGEARYLAGRTSAADFGERAYWDYEINIKRLETAVGSMVGGDGAIYAIRRPLWRELPENAINDFLNPLQIVEAGWRAVYEPLAVCYEETAGGVRSEYRRRVRIISRSWRAVFEASGVLNPRRVGLFTWSLVSHKMLRWLSGFVATHCRSERDRAVWCCVRSATGCRCRRRRCAIRRVRRHTRRPSAPRDAGLFYGDKRGVDGRRSQGLHRPGLWRLVDAASHPTTRHLTGPLVEVGHGSGADCRHQHRRRDRRISNASR